MMTTDSTQLLREFSRNRSEQAFCGLVREHSPMVFGTALRKLNGDNVAAQDVAQEVFTLLARKADRLGSMVLGGWLYRQTCRRAANHVRSETRRKSRETAAAEVMKQSIPTEISDTRLLARELDDALLSLPGTDRDALVLRYFEGKEYRAVGKTLGIGEEAARKRIQRAVEKLGDSLKRKGIAVGSISLGTALESFGASPIPAEMISQLTATALQGAAGSAALTTLLKPMLAGVLATSLVTGSALALRQPPPSTAPAPIRTSSRENRASIQADSRPKDSSLSGIILSIKRAISAPQNSLSSLSLKTILARISFADAASFFRLANAQLEPMEKVAAYRPLLEGWLATDPEGVMDLVVTEKIGEQVDRASGTNVLNNLLDIWIWKDLTASQSWLLANWESDVLKESAFDGSLRGFLAAGVVAARASSDGIDPAFEFASQIPKVSDQALALGTLVGMSRWNQPWFQMSNDKILLLHTRLQEFPDLFWRDKLTDQLWANLGKDRPEVVQELMPAMTAENRFKATLGLLAMKVKKSATTPSLSGGIVEHYEPLTDQPEREQAAMEAGIAAGLTKSEILSSIGRVLCGCTDDSEFFTWHDKHRDEIQMNDSLAAKARERANTSGWSKGNEMVAMEWARRISDPELRLTLVRGIFRKSLMRFPEAALDYLNRSDLPPDLAAELRTIISPSP